MRHNSPYPSSNITVKDDVLLAGNALQPYIKAQITILKRTYLDPVFAGPQPTELISGVDEAMLLLIRHKPLNGTSVMQVQTYARIDKWIGILTLTSTDNQLLNVRKDYERFVRTLAIAEADTQTEGASPLHRAVA